MIAILAEYVVCYSSAFFLGVICGIGAMFLIDSKEEKGNGKRGR